LPLQINDVEKVSTFNVEETVGICTVTITEYNSDGTTNTHTYQYETSTAQDCFNSAQAVIAAHNQK
jgi:hypothetical protein